MRYRELDSEGAIFERMGGKNNKFNCCHNSVSNFCLETRDKEKTSSEVQIWTEMPFFLIVLGVLLSLTETT